MEALKTVLAVMVSFSLMFAPALAAGNAEKGKILLTIRSLLK